MNEYGHAHTIELSDHSTLHVKSDAEARFARLLDVAWAAGNVIEWQYEPQSFALAYKYRCTDLAQCYTPDFRAVWEQEGEVWYEVKRGRLDQKYANKIVRFCRQYPDITLELVWFGPLPKPRKRNGKANRVYILFEKVQRVARVWHIGKDSIL